MGHPPGNCRTAPPASAGTGHAWCDWCLGNFPTADVDVDHVRPLSMGGTDTDGNVQALCRGCHRLKTGAEFGSARAT
ncbi:HNH endonuclease [Streptomyces sp. NPDC008121]|uniref:HNH endonuclease n=1 Tax=Streptomyces sp. NPDC008121 TaxID=3364809 RepID=UPI0036E78CAF